MYSLFMLLAAVAIGAQVQALRRGRWSTGSLYGVSTAPLLWTQYFAVLPIARPAASRFAWAIWRDRHDRGTVAPLAQGLGAVGVVHRRAHRLPMLPILRDQLAAYGNRGAGLVPGQAGAGSSTIGGTISIYAVGANLIWAVLGYHADGAMVQIAALWPLLMLLALVMLGRGRSGPQPAAARRSSSSRWPRCSPRLAASATCSSCATSPVPCRRCCCSAPASSRRRRCAGPRVVVTGVRAHGGDGRRARRPAAQRRQPAPLRLPGRVRRRSRRDAEPGRHRAVRAVVPGRGRRLLRAGPDGRGRSARPSPTDVGRVGARHRAGAAPRTPSARLGTQLADLEQERRHRRQSSSVPNVRVWELVPTS